MSKRRAVIGAVLIAGVVTVSTVILRHRAKPAPGTVAESDAPDDIRRLEAKIARLEAVTAWQAAQLGQLGSAKPQAADGENGASPLSDGGASRQEPKTEAEALAQNEEKFLSEPRDSNWGGEATVQATRALSSDMPSGSHLGKIECRTNTCRVESSHKDLEAFQAFVQAALLSRTKKLWNGGFSAQVTEQSASGVTAGTFVTREGYSNPSPEAVPN